MNYKTINTILLCLFLNHFLLAGQQAIANINGAHAVDATCPPVQQDNQSGKAIQRTLIAGKCVISSSKYVPASGYYKVKTRVFDEKKYALFTSATTTSAYLDATKSIKNQNVTVTGSTTSYSAAAGSSLSVCQTLVDSNGKEYFVNTSGSCTSGTSPLPDVPTVPPTSCSINNGNVIDIDLKTIERSKLPTIVAQTDQTVIYPFAVDCTGGVEVNLNLQLNFTAITVGSSQAIQTTSTGLGVGVGFFGTGYSETILQTTTVIPVKIAASGHSDLNLEFQPVRNPKYNVDDIPTGDFTASAVLVMTQQ